MAENRTPLIFDGDMGGDDLWALSIILAHPEQFGLLGIASCYGNVEQPFATNNMLNHLHWIGHNVRDVAQGAEIPCDGMRSFGDGAYGENGVGGIVFEASPQEAWQGDITDWYVDRLKAAPGPVTILCTGPATNIALLLEKHPEAITVIDRLVFMGGAINPPGNNGAPHIMPNGQKRSGNITVFAEFNAYQDPKALNIILKSGIDIVFAAADVTQYMVFTEARQNRIKAIGGTYGPAFHRMLNAVEALDRSYFGVEGAFIHDPTAAIYLLAPELFNGDLLINLKFDESSPRPLQTTRRGQALTEQEDGSGPVLWLNRIHDTDRVFDLMVNALEIIAARAQENQASPEV